MNVKIFESSYITPLEKDMNQWFEDNPNIIIKHIKQSTAQYTNGSIHTIVSIFYNNKPIEQETYPF